MKTKLPIIAVALILLAGGFAVRATREAERTKAAIQVLASQRTGLRDRIVAAEQRRQKAAAALAKLEKEIRQLPGEPNVGAAAPTSEGVAPTKPAIPARRLSPATIIANDPQKMAEYGRNLRASLDLTYGGMAKALGLSAEQVERLKELKVLKEQQQLDRMAAAELHGLDRTSKAYQKLLTEQDKFRMAKEAEIVGHLETPYREYYRTQVVRDLAQELAGTSVYSGVPVTSDQVERTAQILAASSQRERSGVHRGWVEWNTINWEVASTQLQGVLSPAQIAALANIVQWGAARDALNQQIARLTAQFKGLPPPK